MSPEARSSEAVSDAAAEESWRQLLAHLESDLRRARAGESLVPWHPPARMPALPTSLLTRALALREAQGLLAASAARERELTLRALARSRRAAQPAGRAPIYLDAVG